MNSEYELIEKIKPFRNIIVYGAKYRGLVVVERLKFYLLNSDIHVAVSDTKGELAYCSDLLVRNIKDIAVLPSCVVLIAAQEKFREEMEKYAYNIGFSNIIRISEYMFGDMSIRYEVYKNATKIDELNRMEKHSQFLIDELSRIEKHSQFLQHYTLNQIRLNRLRDKVKNGKRIKVIFLLSSVAKFSLSSVYRALEKKDELFDCAIFCFEEYKIEEFSNISDSKLDELRLYCEQLKTEKFNIIWGYDDRNNPIGLETCFPDIVIHNSPFLVTWKREANQSIDRIVSNYLSCCIPYGMHASNEPEYHFNLRNIACSWLHFIGTRQAFNLCSDFAITKGINAVLSGWPGLDGYTQAIRYYPNKYQEKRLIIYAPHWSIETWHNTSTFHIHYKLFLEMLEKHPDIHFIFKPHPRLGPEIFMREGRKDATRLRYEDYVTYCNTWEKYPNGSIVTDDSFIDLFKKADCLITDSYSFITIWLPTEKPCIYLMNPEGPEDPYKYYYDFIHPVINSYYVCKTAEEIEKTFKEVVIDGNDPKAEERKKQRENLIYNLGNAGEFIANYIERQLKD